MLKKTRKDGDQLLAIPANKPPVSQIQQKRPRTQERAGSFRVGQHFDWRQSGWASYLRR
jgi:hypothetical protein